MLGTGGSYTTNTIVYISLSNNTPVCMCVFVLNSRCILSSIIYPADVALFMDSFSASLLLLLISYM